MGEPETSRSQTGPATPAAKSPRDGTWERLRTYLIGVAIGVILLGTFWMMKRQAMQNQKGATSQPQQSAPSGGR